MSAGAEVFTIDEWLYERLTEDTGVQAAMAAAGVPEDTEYVFSDEAPADAPNPFLVFTLNDGTDVRAIASTPFRVMTNGLYLVKAVCEGPSYGPLRPIVAAMDAAISGPGNSTDNGVVFGCARDTPIRYAEPATAGGRQYRHLGGLYRINAQ